MGRLSEKLARLGYNSKQREFIISGQMLRGRDEIRRNVSRQSYARERLCLLVAEEYEDEAALKGYFYCMGELVGKTAAECERFATNIWYASRRCSPSPIPAPVASSARSTLKPHDEQ